MGKKQKIRSIPSINKAANRCKREVDRVMEYLQCMPAELIKDDFMVDCYKTTERHLSYNFTKDGRCGVNLIETFRRWDREVEHIGGAPVMRYIKEYCITATFFVIDDNGKTLQEYKMTHSPEVLRKWLWTALFVTLYGGKQLRKSYEKNFLNYNEWEGNKDGYNISDLPY